MKKIALFLAIAAGLHACGDAGVQFDVNSEFPVSVPIEIIIPGNPTQVTIPSFDIDPIEYKLDAVDGFSSALDLLEAIVIEDISYELSDVSLAEQVPVNLVQLVITLGSGPLTFTIAENQLVDTGKVSLDLSPSQQESFAQELLSGQELSAELVVDLPDIQPGQPGYDIVANFTVFFDVTLQARDLN